MEVSKIILALFIAQILCLFIPQSIFCQTETIDIVTYIPPKGWAKTPKEGAVVYTDINKNTGKFCLLTVYAGTPSADSPSKDFTNEWNKFVVAPFKAEANPKTETQTNPEGWQATVSGTNIELEGGVKAAAVLTVFSGFGKTASVLAIFNDESYLAQASALIDSIKLDKTKPTNSPQPVQNDPFPDRPGYQPQKPLSGTLKSSITMADLVGTWGTGAASVQAYIDSNSGNYAGTDTTFYSDQHVISPDGSFEYKFTGRASNHTVRETDSGTVILSGDNIIFKFKGRTTYRYQIIAYMIEPNGAAVLSLVHLGENEKGYDGERMKILCDHAHGYIQCQGGEEWGRLKPTK